MTMQLERGRTGRRPAAEQITDAFLAARAALPPAANGKPPRSESARVRYLRNEIGAQRMTPFDAVLDVVEDDLACGVPVSEHLAWIDRLRADVETLAVREHDRRQSDVPVQIQLVRELLKETDAECKANPVQDKVLVEPTNLVALEAFAERGTRHQAQLSTALRLVQRQISVIRNSSRRVYGAGRRA